MSFNIREDVLFVGLGSSAVCYYRCMLPALSLGCDWSGVAGAPPTLQYTTGLVRGDTRMPNLEDYKVVVIQQPHTDGWVEEIKKLQAAGIKVLFEVDDYLHGIPKLKDHDFAHAFTPKRLAFSEVAMRTCDGMIVSTEFIAKRYRKFNPNVWVCENALDLARYNLTKPQRETINIGWAGATGHRRALEPWLRQVVGIMQMHPEAAFVSVGQPFAQAIEKVLGAGRAMAVPFAQIEQYPAAMTMFDIALAPAGKGSFFRGKSDLRWLEAGALGVPIIADPMVYGKIDHGVNGFLAQSPQDVAVFLRQLLVDEELRTEVGAAARKYVEENRAFPAAAQQWRTAIEGIVE